MFDYVGEIEFFSSGTVPHDFTGFVDGEVADEDGLVGIGYKESILEDFDIWDFAMIRSYNGFVSGS